MIEKDCPACGKAFKTYPSIKSRTCSKGCANQWSKLVSAEARKKFCTFCGGSFVPKHNKSPGLFCSYKCTGAHRRVPSITRGKYTAVYAPNHANSSKQGYVLEHRWIMSQHLGRQILPGEVVHHKDGNPNNNCISNLELMTDSEHKQHHASIRPREDTGTFTA